MTTPTIAWHYTTGDRLASILAAGEIVPSKEGLDGAARPTVWFSSRASWEPTATRAVVIDGRRRNASIPEMVASAGPLARIGMSPSELTTWLQHRQSYLTGSVRRLS